MCFKGAKSIYHLKVVDLRLNWATVVIVHFQLKMVQCNPSNDRLRMNVEDGSRGFKKGNNP